AVALPGRRRSVGEDMAKIAVAPRAADLGADHPAGAVLDLNDGVLGDWPCARRATCSRLGLLTRLAEWLAAGAAHVGCRLARSEKTALPGRLRAVLPQYTELLGRKPLPPLFFAQYQLGCHDLCRPTARNHPGCSIRPSALSSRRPHYIQDARSDLWFKSLAKRHLD